MAIAHFGGCRWCLARCRRGRPIGRVGNAIQGYNFGIDRSITFWSRSVAVDIEWIASWGCPRAIPYLQPPRSALCRWNVSSICTSVRKVGTLGTGSREISHGFPAEEPQQAVPAVSFDRASGPVLLLQSERVNVCSQASQAMTGSGRSQSQSQ